MISSSTNSKVKSIRALARKQARHAARQFVIEGVRVIEEALGAGVVPALVLYSARGLESKRGRALIEQLRKKARSLDEVSDAILRELAVTETPQGILAAVPFPDLPLPAQPRFALILDAVRDPGNLGAILRAARAAGVDAIYFAPETVDPFNDKVVRAAAGAHFVLPLRVCADWEELQALAKKIPRVYLADAHGEIDYRRADWSKPVALIIGGEADGASRGAQEIATARVRIPMRGGDSLNAAMAATLLLFEAARGKPTNNPDK